MSKRALTIGLGAFSDPLLQALQDTFEPNPSQLTQLRLLSPKTAQTLPDFTAETLALSLDKRALSDLYFDPYVRSWSGPNWLNWGSALWSNRLIGRLCAYHHKDKIEAWVADNMTRTSGHDDLTIYLLAPLHDPFASGALVDIAYLLHNIILKRKAKLCGILVLPGTENDPMVAQREYYPEGEAHEQHDQTVQTTKFLRATTYAALRELNFISNPAAFTPTHRSSREFSDSLHTSHLSPFTSGDCYIIGGETREDNTPLPYQTLANETARFIYLNTVSKLGDQLFQSRKDRPLFSTFSAVDQQVATTEDLRRSRNTDDISLKRAQYMVLNYLNRQDISVNTDGFIDISLIRLPSEEPPAGAFSRADQSAQRTRGDIQETLLGEELSYQREINTFREMARKLSETSQTQLKGLSNVWRTQFQTLITHPSMTLLGLQQTIESAQRLLNEQYVGYEKTSEDIEREALAQAVRMNAARTQYLYLMQRDGQSLFFIITFIFIAAVTFMLWSLGQGFLTLIWLASAIFLPWLVSGLVRHQRETAAATRLHAARDGFLSLQSEVAQRRALSAHFYEITQRFTYEIVKPTHRMIAVHKALLNEAEESTIGISTSNPLDIKLSPLASDVLMQIYQATHKTTNTVEMSETVSDILGKLRTFILEQQLRVDTSTQSASTLNQITKDAQKISTMLPLIDSQISEQDRNSIQTIIGISQFGPNLIDRLRENHQQNSQEQQNVNFHDISDDLGGNQAEQRLYVIRQRVNIPLRALLILPDFREVYHQQSTEATHNQTVRRRSFFHPTRWGVAAPDLLRHPPEITRSQPNFVPLLVITLRLATESDITGQTGSSMGHLKSMIGQLCQRLGVVWQPDIDYDALCGALHEDFELINQLTAKVTKSPIMPPIPSGNDILDIACRRAKSALPVVSEKYADWEVAAARQMITLAATDSSNAHRILQRVAANFGSANTLDDLL